MALEIAPDDEFDDTASFAEQTKFTERTVRRWIQDGELKAVYVAGKYLIPRTEKTRFLKERFGVLAPRRGEGASDAA